MSNKQKKQVSDKVPKGMLKSTKELPVKNEARRPVINKKPIRKQAPPNNAPNPPRNPPRKPVNTQTKKAVARAMNARTATKKRRKFRGGNYILYYIMAAIIVVIVMIVLANTVLFRCGDI